MVSEKPKKVGTNKFPITKQPRQILRTIVLPNDKINSLQVEVENLRRENEEQRLRYEKVISQLKQDRRAREEEMRLKYVDRMNLCDDSC